MPPGRLVSRGAAVALRRRRHEPLVSVKTWQRVQELLTQKSTSGEEVRKHHHYLKGTA